MMKLKLSLIYSLLIFGFGAMAQTNQKQAVDDYLTSHKKELTGLKKGFAIKVLANEQVFYQYQSGSFNDETVVPIASASKWLSGALIMKLVDENVISLSDPLKKYFSNVPLDKAEITIQQLFSHTAGFPEKGTFELIKMRKWNMEAQCKSIFEIPLKAKPGTEFNYTGYGMQVAGCIAEMVTHKNYEALFQEKIAKPLGMLNTTFSEKGNTPQVAGGAHSSLNDYVSFLNMLAHKGIFNGKRILSEKAIENLLNNQTTNATIGYSPFSQYINLFDQNMVMKYGIGNWREEDKNGKLMISSSPGAFGFTPWIDFKHQQYGVLVTLKSEKIVFPVYIGFRKKLNPDN